MLISCEQPAVIEANEEAVRRVLRARCPLLLERLPLPLDGSLHGGWPTKAIMPEILRYLRRSFSGDASVRETAPMTPALMPERLRAIFAETDIALPPTAEPMARLTVLEVTPRKAHAYWHLPPHLLHHARLQMGHGGQEAALVLRFHDVTEIAASGQAWDGVRRHHVFDIEIRADEGKRYIEFWSADKAYIVDLGLCAKDGRFLTISRSNWLRLPRDRAGSDKEEWHICEALRTPPLRPEAPECFPPQGQLLVCGGEFDWPLRDLAAESIIKWAYTRFLREGSRVFRRIALRKADNAVLTAAYEKRQAERGSVASAPAAENKPAAPAADLFVARLDRSPHLPPRAPAQGIRQPLVSRNGFARWSECLSRQTNAKLLWLGDRRWQAAADKLRHRFTVSDSNCKSLPSSTTSRPVLRLYKPKNLFQALAEAGVEMEAEIILRGRVKPGKKIRIGNRLIETNPDGTFCVACMLKDGKLHVPVEVVEGERIALRGTISAAPAGA